MIPYRRDGGKKIGLNLVGGTLTVEGSRQELSTWERTWRNSPGKTCGVPAFAEKDLGRNGDEQGHLRGLIPRGALKGSGSKGENNSRGSGGSSCHG